MSINLFFAGWGSRVADDYLQSKNANRLFSQYNERNGILRWTKNELSSKLLIDSGAFTRAHNDVVVDIDDYIQYINANDDIKNWVELDVIPMPLTSENVKNSYELSWQNYLYMRERCSPKVNILPLYHFGEPAAGLNRILNTEVNGQLPTYIGVGGRHGVSTDIQLRYFYNVFNLIEKSNSPNVRVHAFGITVPKILESFPFYSCDSTSWLQTGIYGSVLLKSELTPVHVNYIPKSDLVMKQIEQFGYDVDTVINDYKSRLCYNIDILLDYAENYVYKGPKTFSKGRLF